MFDHTRERSESGTRAAPRGAKNIPRLLDRDRLRAKIKEVSGSAPARVRFADGIDIDDIARVAGCGRYAHAHRNRKSDTRCPRWLPQQP
jgi:hypothetical protein